MANEQPNQVNLGEELLRVLAQMRLNPHERVDSYRVPKIAPFFRCDPTLWFTQVDAFFRRARITDQPVEKEVKKKVPTTDILFAANDSRMHTYGKNKIAPNLNLRREFPWNFHVAEVPYPIIGVDFLAHYRLIPYLHDSRLVDATTNLSIAGFVRGASIFGISAVDRSQPFNQILVDYPQITRVIYPYQRTSHLRARQTRIAGQVSKR